MKKIFFIVWSVMGTHFVLSMERQSVELREVVVYPKDYSKQRHFKSVPSSPTSRRALTQDQKNGLGVVVADFKQFRKALSRGASPAGSPKTSPRRSRVATPAREMSDSPNHLHPSAAFHMGGYGQEITPEVMGQEVTARLATSKHFKNDEGIELRGLVRRVMAKKMLEDPEGFRKLTKSYADLKRAGSSGGSSPRTGESSDGEVPELSVEGSTEIPLDLAIEIYKEKNFLEAEIKKAEIEQEKTLQQTRIEQAGESQRTTREGAFALGSAVVTGVFMLAVQFMSTYLSCDS